MIAVNEPEINQILLARIVVGLGGGGQSFVQGNLCYYVDRI